MSRRRRWLFGSAVRWLLPLGLALASPGGAGLALAQGPWVSVPGFVVESFQDCTAHAHGSVGSIPEPRSASCTPAAWGPERLVVGVHDTFTHDAELLFVDPPNPATLFTSLGDLDDLTVGEMKPSPPGWPAGDLLYVAERDGWLPDRVTGFSALSEQGERVDTLRRYSSTARIGSIALDPSGGFGHDVFFSMGGEVLRRDPGGRVSAFLPFAVDEMQFGPGGEWGTDLYIGTSIVSPDGTMRPSLIVLPLGPWASGPGFEGDMFSPCGYSSVCRITARKVYSGFAGGLDRPVPTWCGGALWFFEPTGAGCTRITASPVDVTAEIWPTHMNSRARGSSFSITTRIVERSTGLVVDPTLLEPAYISRIMLPYADDPVIPVPSAEPGCDSATQDGIWETPGSRKLNGDGSMEIVFDEPSDGNCETLDGDRRDLVALLQWVHEEEQVTICFLSRHPDVPGAIEGCGEVTGINRGKTHLRVPVPLELPVRTRP